MNPMEQGNPAQNNNEMPRPELQPQPEPQPSVEDTQGVQLAASQTEPHQSSPQPNITSATPESSTTIAPAKSANGNKFSKLLNKKLLIPVAAGLVAVVAIVAGVMIFKGSGNGAKSLKDLDKHDTIVIENEDEKYALFDTVGNQLTGFDYDYISTFKKGTALARDNSGNDVLIDSKGKVFVDNNAYVYIDNAGYLYRAATADGKDVLLNSDGKVVFDLSEGAKVSTSYSPLVVVDENGSYNILGHDGNIILKIQKTDDDTFDIEDFYISDMSEVASKHGPIISEYDEGDTDGLYAISYNGTTYIVDFVEGKKVNEFSSTDAYCITSVNEQNRNQYILSGCDRDSSKAKEFTYYDGNSLKFTTTECESLEFDGSGTMVCQGEDKDGYDYLYLMSESGEKGINTGDFGISYLDFGSYIKEDKHDTTKFTKDGSEVATVKCVSPYYKVSRKARIYALENTCDKHITYTYYDDSGNKLIDKKFEEVEAFDDNGLAVVKENEDDRTEYLIDAKGNKVSEDYDNIYPRISEEAKLYKAVKDDKKYLLNEKGEVIISSDNEISLPDDYVNYFIIYEDDGDTKVYYTLSGKEFFRD